MSDLIIDPKQLMKDTSFNPETLDSAMMSQSGLFSHYAMIAAKAQETSDNKKMKRDVTESKIYKQIRDLAAIEGRMLTEKMIDCEMKADIRWVRVQKEYNASRAEAELCRHALEALKQKKDMMVQIGVGMREEFKGQVRVKTAEAATERSSSLREKARNLAKG